MSGSGVTERVPEASKETELAVFAALVVFLAPAVSVILVGSVGLATWIYQLAYGPPAG